MSETRSELCYGIYEDNLVQFSYNDDAIVLSKPFLHTLCKLKRSRSDSNIACVIPEDQIIIVITKDDTLAPADVPLFITTEDEEDYSNDFLELKLFEIAEK
jgi:hypothetical protein